MFQLSDEEAAALRSQSAILKTGRGQHRKYLPYAFTEQGVAMLSSVLDRFTQRRNSSPQLHGAIGTAAEMGCKEDQGKKDEGTANEH